MTHPLKCVKKKHWAVEPGNEARGINPLDAREVNALMNN